MHFFKPQAETKRIKQGGLSENGNSKDHALGASVGQVLVVKASAYLHQLLNRCGPSEKGFEKAHRSSLAIHMGMSLSPMGPQILVYGSFFCHEPTI